MKVKLPIPENEDKRLKKLDFYAILDTIPEETFDDLTRLASDILKVPIALISLLDKDRQWFKSRVGLEVEQTSRSISFCQYAIIDNDIFEIKDALQDIRFKDNPLVKGDPNIRFYAGVPLTDDEGYNIGTLCLIDRKPRILTDKERDSLRRLSRTVIRLIQYRKEKLELEMISQLKDDFLSNMSHEIRTPMHAIMGFSNLLSESFLSIEQRKNVNIITMASANLLNILNNILFVSKLESGRLKLDIRSINLEKAMKQITELHQVNADAKGIKLILKYDYDIPECVMGDITRITQVFGNLISNAIKFTEAGSITFSGESKSISENQALILFQVSDTGIGIPRDNLEMIFERFIQAEMHAMKKYEGAGLGLGIAKELSELMGGSISVKSTVGQGTTFSVEIPFEISDSGQIIEQDTQLTINSNKKNGLKGINILVVEDNNFNQKFVEILLRKNGGKYEFANNGKEAVNLLKKNEYDVVLLDLQMPEMNGYQTCEFIRNELELAVPIIGCSAYSSIKEKTKCLALGMNDYITKPFLENILINSILEHVQLENRK